MTWPLMARTMICRTLRHRRAVARPLARVTGQSHARRCGRSLARRSHRGAGRRFPSAAAFLFPRVLGENDMTTKQTQLTDGATMTTQEVAALLKVTPTTVRVWAK